MTAQSKLIYWLSHIDEQDGNQLGLQAVHLAELLQSDFPIANGFVMSSSAYFDFLNENKLRVKIKNLLSTVHYEHPESLRQVAHHIKQLIHAAKLPQELIDVVRDACFQLSNNSRQVHITIYPSIIEKNPLILTHSIENDSYFRNNDNSNIFNKVKECWALLFAPSAILFRHEHAIDQFKPSIAVIIQEVITPEISGKLFTIHPNTNDKTTMLIENMNEKYKVNKKNLTITKMIQSTLSDEQIIQLAQLGKRLEKHFYFPQEVEWGITKGKIYLLKTHDITIPS